MITFALSKICADMSDDELISWRHHTFYVMVHINVCYYLGTYFTDDETVCSMLFMCRERHFDNIMAKYKLKIDHIKNEIRFLCN